MNSYVINTGIINIEYNITNVSLCIAFTAFTLIDSHLSCSTVQVVYKLEQNCRRRDSFRSHAFVDNRAKTPYYWSITCLSYFFIGPFGSL